PSGEQYVVGCGIYNAPMEKVFIVEKVEYAAEFLKIFKRTAFPIFKNKASEFIFKDTYIFVLDDQGTLLVEPKYPILEGKNVSEYKDAEGKLLYKECINLAKEKGSGWVDYKWVDSETGKKISKTSYIQKVETDGKTYILGAGMCLTEI
ncbi:cache domain-containing protein, partial [Candidatus Margulisiibacteriota bacterium]